ncbi:MAG TPA: Stp1/IreP family PP2C-type Ser/Thr phosphatase [Solirubrobacteraceae bacterium]|nr:Stp1/IreP family PP2C-type Ser/Thr phosphatase [Solirubrobacteraceae bacterium]
MIRVADYIVKTDPGRQRRQNEDSAYARSPLFVVADGMGGAQAGEVASHIAVEVFEQGLPDTGNPEERLAQRVREANRQIHDRSLAEHGREGMGTTITALWLEDSQVSIAHVGDSRAYLFRDGELRRLTQDHTLVDELVRRGKLTEEQAAEHPQRSIITRALGPEKDVDVDTVTYEVRPGDVLLLCSDGLTGMVSEERIAKVLAGAPTLEQAGNQLIDEANAAGGRDNITVVACRLEAVDQELRPEEATIIAPPSVRTPAPAERAPDGAPAAAPVAVATPPPGTPLRPEVPAGRPAGVRRRLRTKPVAIALSVVIVLGLILGGGYLASQQLFFIGTNSQGIVTIYRGFPYNLPLGIQLYGSFYESGVPASLVPADRRKSFFDHHLRSQSNAMSLVRSLELGKVSK